MPQLKLALNLGTKDGAKLGLDADHLKEGTLVDVTDEAAEELLRRGWAVEPKAEKSAEKLAPQATPSTSATPPVGEAQKEPVPPSGPSHFAAPPKGNKP